MKGLFRFIGVLSLFFSMCTFALELEYGRYNINAHPHADCIDTVCEIVFEENYASTPLVFFMDTVSFQDETDCPSTIRILDINSTRVRFQQKFAPSSREPPGMQNLPMKVIDYLVIEKGVHNFSSGVQVLAGDISTNKFRTKIDIDINPGAPVVRPPNRNQRERVQYSQFNGQGFTGFGSKPGIIHQVQSVANGENFWLTSTVYGVNNSRFDIALERSEIDGRKPRDERSYPTQNERIGYIAAVGSGEKDDIKFSIETQQTKNSYNTGDPVSTGCETYADYDNDYDVVPIIIASKNTRSGGDGGWVRRCRLETAKSSFLVDEDQDNDAERMHIVETLGYIIFEVPFTVNQCTQFTGAAQTWDTDGEIEIENSAKITGSVANNRLGFADVDAHNNSCDTGQCVADPSLMVPDYGFASFTPGPNDYSKSSGSHTISPGHYDKIEISNSAKVTFEPGEYWADEIILKNNAEIFMQGEVTLHSNEFSQQNSSKANEFVFNDLLTPGIPNNLKIIVHGDDALATFQNNAVMRGFVISEEDIIMQNSANLTGAIASLDVEMKNNAKLHGDISSCNDDVIRTLSISPPSGTQVVNQTIPITFSIVNSQGVVDSNAYGNLNLTQTGGTNVCWKPSENGACISDPSSVPISAGMGTYYLFGSVQATANITATWVERPAVNASAGEYKFEINGFVFEPSPLLMIAGQETTVTIKAVDNAGIVLPSYEGAKSLQVSATAKVLPATGNLNASLVSGNVTFTDGIATAKVKYFDAGKVSVTVEETGGGVTGDMQVHSRPHTFAICNIMSNGLNKSYKGTATSGDGFAKAGETFSVTVKPLTWLGATAVSTDSSSDGNSDAITDSLCSHATTPNYYTVGGQFARVRLSHALHSPAGKQLGVLNQVNATNQLYNFTTTGEAQSGLVISGLSWNEVGSIWLQADYANYVLGAVNQGVAAIGRFYPHHFALSSGVVNEGQSNFTYMNQGFGTQFQVSAQSQTQLTGGVAKTITKNYEFMTNYQMAIELKAVDASKHSSAVNDLTSRIDMSDISTVGWKSDWSDGTLGIALSLLKFERVKTSSMPVKTVPDGPYRVLMGLEVNSGVLDCDEKGCTAFDETDAYRNGGSGDKPIKGLTEELDMRYGRLVMSDVGGNSGRALTVPLKAQHWNGSRFVTNTLDNGSAFNGDNYCLQKVWPSAGTSEASLNGSGNVINGRSNQLSAIQSTATSDVREQVKLWLRIGTAPTGFETGLQCEGVGTGNLDYLHYNWDGRGDENPRATLTFGVYRGNDRVIFRGEPRAY